MTQDPAPDPAKPRCQLSGEDGNVFHVIGIVRRSLREAGLDEEASELVDRAFACKAYDEVLRLCFEYVEVE